MIHLTSAIGSQVTSAGGVVLRCSSAKRAGSSTTKKLFCLFHSASRRESEKTYNSIKMADMVQKFSAVTLSNGIMNYEVHMTAAIVTKLNEG